MTKFGFGSRELTNLTEFGEHSRRQRVSVCLQLVEEGNEKRNRDIDEQIPSSFGYCSHGHGHGHGHGTHSPPSSHEPLPPVVGSGVRYVSGTSHAHVTTTTPPTNTHHTTKPTLPRSASYQPHVPPTNTFPSVSVSRECRQCLEQQQQHHQQQQRRESHPRESHSRDRDNSHSPHHHGGHTTYQPAPHATISYSKRHDGDTFSTAPTYLSSGPVERDWIDDDSIAPGDSISQVGIYPNGYPSGHPLEVYSSSRR